MFSAMKPVKFLLKLFAAGAMALAIIIACTYLFMKFYGNAIVEKYLQAMIGQPVKIESVSLNMDKGAVNFHGFTIVSQIDLDAKIFNAEKVTVYLNKEKYEKEKVLVLDEVYIKKGILNIERRKDGTYNIASLGERGADEAGASGSAAYAQEVSESPLYSLAKGIRKITVEDCTVNFKDHLISREPFFVYFDNVNFNFLSGQTIIKPEGFVSVKCAFGLRIPKCRYGDGSISFSADMAVYPDRVDMETNLQMKYIDLMLFAPYIPKDSPFSFNDGLFSSETAFRMHNNVINSLTTIIFHKISLYINPGMENAEFLSASVNQIAKYLTSSKGEILFDFVIQGPSSRPAMGLGPKVKFAIGMVIIEELGKALAEMQRAQ